MENKFYHYTSVQALFGIIESKSFWLVSGNNTNDPNELKYAEKAITEALEYISSNDPQFDFAAKEYIEEKRNSKTKIINNTGYFMCFSEQSDSLNHWRYYADNQTGIAIACDFSKIDYAFEKLGFKGLNSVIDHFNLAYNNQDVIKMIRELMDKYFNGRKITSRKSYEDLIEYAMPRIKGDAFQEEHEHRLFRTYKYGFGYNDNYKNVEDKLNNLIRNNNELGLSSSKIKFYCNGQIIRPYYQIDIQKLAELSNIDISEIIPEIVLGPLCRQNKNDLRIILNRAGMKKTIINVSKIKIRR